MSHLRSIAVGALTAAVTAGVLLPSGATARGSESIASPRLPPTDKKPPRLDVRQVTRTQLAAEGIKLTPDEAGASVVIAGASKSLDEVTVTPPGCAASDCKSTVTVPAASESVAPEATRTVYVLGKNKATAAARNATAESPATRAAAVYSRTVTGDQMCGNLGCWSWHMNLSSQAYYDYSYAWGTRSRFGRAGYVNCNVGGTGFSLTRQECQFYGDPSPSGLYASMNYLVSGLVSGSPISQTHYLHRHYNSSGGTWLVAN